MKALFYILLVYYFIVTILTIFFGDFLDLILWIFYSFLTARMVYLYLTDDNEPPFVC